VLQKGERQRKKEKERESERESEKDSERKSEREREREELLLSGIAGREGLVFVVIVCARHNICI